MKSLLGIASIFAALSPPVSVNDPAPYNAIHLIQCGAGYGTAFEIAPGRYITAAHVTSSGPCAIEGSPAKVVHQDTQLDISELSAPPIGPVLTLSCDRPKQGKAYYAIGYAGGRFRIDARIYATGKRHDIPAQTFLNGDAIFYGNAIPGMSGGPILNGDDEVVAIVNAGNAMMNTVIGRMPLDTYLCGGRK